MRIARRGPRSTVRVLQTLEELDSLRAAWDALAASRSPMERFAWMRACAESFGTNRRLRIFVLERNGRTRAIAPLVMGRGGRLELLGVSELFEPTDFIHDDPGSARELAAAVSRYGAGLRIQRMPRSSPTLPALRRAYRWRGYVRIRPTESFPSIPLDPTWREPERHFSARRRSDFRRARRKADAAGAVGFETLAPGPNELPALLDEAFAVETAGWKGIGGTSLAADRRLGGFFRRYAELAAEEGSLRLEFMRIDGRAVAMQLGVETNGRRYLFKIGYDERFSRCSPGTLLMLHSVGHAVREGAVAYEFLGHREGWTDVWTHVEMPCVAVRAYPFTAAGLVSLGSDLASVVANHLPQWMPFAS